MHRFSWLVGLFAFALLSPLLARAQPVSLAEADTTVPAGTTTLATERFRPGPISWQPCPENAAVECGTLMLPVDYAQPHGEMFGMAVVRARAFDTQARIGMLVLNNGGPAASGVDFVLAGVGVPAFNGLRAGFDVVSFDVRGSHRSHPVGCKVEPLGELPADAAEQVAVLDAFSQRFAESCVAQNGPFIRTMSFNTIARDMDMLRRALRERQISYIGLSFGTTLGAVYASQFPNHVRAMVLDSGAPPEFRDSLVEFTAEQITSFEQTLHRLDRVCRKDAACGLRDEGVVPTLDLLLARLREAPVTAPDGTLFDDTHLQAIVTSLLQFDGSWPTLVRALASGRDGDYALLFQLVPSISRVPLSETAFFAIKCNSFGTRRSAAEYLPVSEAVGGITPRLHDPLHVASIVAICAAWPPADVPLIRNVQGRLDHPILMLGTDFDPNSPLSWTRNLAYALGAEASLVRYQGGGHTIATRATPCIGAIVGAYLFELVAPAEGATCPARPLNFGPAAQLQAPQTTTDMWGEP